MVIVHSTDLPSATSRWNPPVSVLSTQYSVLQLVSSAHKLAISFSTRSSIALNGSLQRTVRCA